jgi:hypothetical protein
VKLYPDLAFVVSIGIGDSVCCHNFTIKFNTFGELEKIGFCYRLIKKNMIDLLSFIFRMCEFSCQIAIICEQKNPCCCLIKPPYRINLPTAVGYRLALYVMRVFNSRNINLRFIQQDVNLLGIALFLK